MTAQQMVAYTQHPEMGTLFSIFVTSLSERLQPKAKDILTHLNERLLIGTLKSHEVEDKMRSPLVRVQPDFPQIRPALVLLHAICLIQEERWPDALESLVRAEEHALTKAPAAVMKVMLFELQGNYPEADAHLTNVIKHHYSAISTFKDMYIWLALLNVQQGLIALAQNNVAALKATARRVLALDKKSIQEGYQGIAEFAFRATTDCLAGDFRTVLSSTSARRLPRRIKRLLAEGMRVHLGQLKLKLTTDGPPVSYMTQFVETVYSAAANDTEWTERYVPASVATLRYKWDADAIRSYCRELIPDDDIVAVEELLMEGTKRFW